MIAATDYMRAYADQMRSHVPRRYVVLGTDGFGRSDYRVKLRRFFEVNRHYVTVAALKALADDGEIKPRGRRARRSRSTGSTPSGPIPGRSSGERSRDTVDDVILVSPPEKPGEESWQQ